METKSTRKSLIQSVERALNILEMVRDNKGPARAVEIARAVGLSPAAANNIVRTLFIRGYLDQDAGGHYVLGGQSYLLGVAADAWGDLRNAARDAMLEVSRATGNLCFLGVEYQGQIVAVNLVEGSGPLVTPRNQNWTDQFHCTAVGKILLAGMAPERYAELKGRHQLRKLTERSITDWAKLELELDLVRSRGYSLCVDESVFGVTSMAVGIAAADGKLEAALALVFSSYYLTPAYEAEALAKLRAAAQAVEGRLRAK